MNSASFSSLSSSTIAGLETLQVSDLQHPVVLFGQRDQLIGLLEGRGDRFFYQDMRPVTQKIPYHVKVQVCRHGNADGLHLSQELMVVSHGHAGGFVCNFLRLSRVRIANGYQLAVFQLMEFQCMELAQVACSDYCRLYLLHAISSILPMSVQYTMCAEH